MFISQYFKSLSSEAQYAAQFQSNKYLKANLMEEVEQIQKSELQVNQKIVKFTKASRKLPFSKYNQIDIVISIQSTRSMAKQVEQLPEIFTQITSKIQQTFNTEGVRLRFALSDYRNHGKGFGHANHGIDFTDLEEILRSAKSRKAWAGRKQEPTAFQHSLASCKDFYRWSSVSDHSLHLFIHITDSVPHGKQFGNKQEHEGCTCGQTMQAGYQGLQKNQVYYTLFKTKPNKQFEQMEGEMEKHIERFESFAIEDSTVLPDIVSGTVISKLMSSHQSEQKIQKVQLKAKRPSKSEEKTQRGPSKKEKRSQSQEQKPSKISKLKYNELNLCITVKISYSMRLELNIFKKRLTEMLSMIDSMIDTDKITIKLTLGTFQPHGYGFHGVGSLNFESLSLGYPPSYNGQSQKQNQLPFATFTSHLKQLMDGIEWKTFKKPSNLSMIVLLTDCVTAENDLISESERIFESSPHTAKIKSVYKAMNSNDIHFKFIKVRPEQDPRLNQICQQFRENVNNFEEFDFTQSHKAKELLELIPKIIVDELI